ncbi:MAG TPA: metallophosphatase family protein, partial [bacterium]|nr:metallophosphatase family protein [bacterium]
MIIALLGDVHSNFPALEAVAKEIKAISPDAVYFLGDAVGY